MATRDVLLEKLKRRAQQLGEDLRELGEHIEKQQAWQREQLERWSNEMANLLTFLMNLEIYLKMGDETNGDDDGAA